MGNSLALIEVPSGTGKLIQISNVPIIVEGSDQFIEAQAILAKFIEEGTALRNQITSDQDQERAMNLLVSLKRYEKYVAEGADPVKNELNDAKGKVMEMLHKLTDPAGKLKADLARSTGNYSLKRQREIQEENDRLARVAEVERQKKQRAADEGTLQAEIDSAIIAIDQSNQRNQPETAKEIAAVILMPKRQMQTPAVIRNPIETATLIRQGVALALQHEDARIAAAAARAEGDKKAAAQIMRNSAKLEAPVVEEIIPEQVHAAPVVVRQPELARAKGSRVTKVWRVKRIYDAARVPREHCEPSLSLLNAHAKRLREQKPVVPGVEFEQIIKTEGIQVG